MSKYADPEYWEERYRDNDTTFDWYVTGEALEPLLRPLLLPSAPSAPPATAPPATATAPPLSPAPAPPLSSPDLRVLVAGCGNSRLSAGLYEQLHVRRIVNVDASPTVIAQMQRRYRALDEMRWVACDLVQTPAEQVQALLCPEDERFDVIIEKGLVDATLGGHNSFHNVYTLTKHFSRMLRKGGRFVSVSYGSPETRIDHFRRRKLFFDVEHKTVEKPVFAASAKPSGKYHVYIMTKIGEREAAAGAENGAAAEDGDSGEEDDFYDRFMMQAATAMSTSGK